MSARFTAAHAAWHRRTLTSLLAIIVCLVCVWCGGSGNGPTQPTSPTSTAPPPGPPVSTPPLPSPPQVFVGAGDIGWCGSPGPEQTAKLLDTIGGTVFTTGDNAYFSGTRQEYLNCYGPSWGRFLGHTRPAPGNHEYGVPDAADYFEYFGAAAGPSRWGYYSFDLGSNWHAISLNSNVPADAGSAQAAWLREDLATSRGKCTIAYWHHALFSSGPNGNHTHMRTIWRILYDAGVDVIVNGHDHLYERFAPQDPDGRPDRARGIREFIVGTGGATLYKFATMSMNSEQQIANTFGVLKLTLESRSYQWEFVPVSGLSDRGRDSCH